MGKPGRDRVPSPLNPVDSATKEGVCSEWPPLGPGGEDITCPTRWPPGAERRLVLETSNLKNQTSKRYVGPRRKLYNYIFPPEP